MVIYAKIRRMFYREHLTISEIQRRTSLSRNTIKKWLQESSGSEPKYQRVKTTGKLTPFKPRLALEADSHRPKRDRRSHAATVTGKSAFVPLKFEFGEAFQFDWSEKWLVIGDIHRKILAAHAKLCASRAFMLSGYPMKATRCCSMRTPELLQLLTALPSAAFTTT